MAFAHIIPIEKALLEKYGKVRLPSDFGQAFLKKYDEAAGRFIGYDIFWQQNKRLYNAGNISVTKRLLEPLVQDDMGAVRLLKGPKWDRHIIIFDSKNPNPTRYGRYGLTMAALYCFTEQLAQNGIEKTFSIIKEDNTASLKFSQKFLGTKNRLRVVEEISQGGVGSYKPEPVFVYETPVEETLAKLKAYTTPPPPVMGLKKLSEHHGK